MSPLRSLKKYLRWRSLCRRAGGYLDIDRTANPRVPLRIAARGPIRVGRNVSFGDKGAPMIGDGAITLQTRCLEAELVIGANWAFSNNVTVVATVSVSFGEVCMVGDLVSVYDSDFHGISPETRHTRGESAAVRIGNNVWLGSRVMVLKGVTIGDNSVVAAGAVVVRDVPANTLVAGVPAKVIRTFAAPESQ